LPGLPPDVAAPAVPFLEREAPATSAANDPRQAVEHLPGCRRTKRGKEKRGGKKENLHKQLIYSEL